MVKTLTKADIVLSIQNENSFAANKSADIIETLLEIIKRTLESGEDVLISGFGKFQVRDKKQRIGRNPATDEGMILPARRVVTFKCSHHLRNRINSRWEGGRCKRPREIQ